MFTIIGGDGKEYGPATLEQVRAWIASGRANLDTQAKRAGEEQWRRLGDFPEFNESGATLPPPTPAAEPLPVNEKGQVVVDPKAFSDDLIARARPLDVFGCLERSFNLWKGHFLPLVGVTLLIIVAQMVLGLIPLLGIVAGPCLNGVFYGGLYFYYLGKMRGEPREVGDAFAGFSQAFVPLMLGSLLVSAFTLVIMAVFGGAFFLPFMQATLHHQPIHLSTFSPGTAVAFGVGMILMIYLSMAWSFTFILIIDKKLGPWTAMEVSRRVVTKQWFRVFFVALLGGILTMLGVIGLFIGVLFTLPLMFGAIVCAYEDLCNPPPRA